MKPNHRLAISLASLLPSILMAIGAELSSGPFPVLAVVLASLGSAILFGLTWFLTQSTSRLHKVSEILSSQLSILGEEKEALIDTFSGISEKEIDHNAPLRLLRNLGERLTERRAQLRYNLKEAANSYSILADAWKKTPSAPTPQTSDSELVTEVQANHSKLVSHLRLLRKRQSAFSNYLRDLQTPLIITDQNLMVMSGNVAAEKLFGLSSKQLQCQKLDQLFFNHGTLAASDDPMDKKPIQINAALGKIKKSPHSEVITVAKGKAGEAIPVAMSCHFDEYIFIQVRDIRPEQHQKKEAREFHRKWTISRATEYFHSKIAEPVNLAKTQSRVLASIIKRSPQNAQALPALMKNMEELDRLSVSSMLLQWLSKAESQQFHLKNAQEIKLSEVADAVSHRLKSQLEEAKTSLEVIDQGAWVFSDPEYVEATLLGIVYHAISAQNECPIRLTLKRNEHRGEETLSVTCSFESKDLPESFISDLENPYQRHQSLLFSTEQQGSVLGLYLSRLLSEKLGGKLESENLRGGLCKITATFPSRPEMPMDDDASWDSREDSLEAILGEFHVGPRDQQIASMESRGSDDNHAIVSLKTEAVLADDTSTSLTSSDTATLSDTLGSWRFGE